MAGEKEKLSKNYVKVIAIICISLYLVALSFFTICSLIRILNTTVTDPVTKIKICFFNVAVSKEMRLILLTAVMGVLGSLIYCMTSIAAYVGNKTFESRWTLWYMLRPFIGIPLAIIVYLALRGGVLNWNSTPDSVNEYGIAAICGLVGLFSKQTIAKLKEIFEAIFPPTKPEELKDKLEEKKK